MPKEVSAGAVVFRKEGNQIYYLLLHYPSGSRKSKNYWDFPKGHIENNESEIETVKREVEEETGLKDIKIIDGFKEYIKYFFKDTYNFKNKEKNKASWIFKMVTFYLTETKTKEIKISFEHQGFKWLLYEEALKQLTFKNAKEILKKANTFILKSIY
ncbi:NUDIX domain-containing protein [Patescibacteria group bacterium]|nr:NUDIX domain-containing protein [Patescibacteria group bacterium]MBU4274560.1 NUDIX domain-containing protein [Patescibacteria group bacterium]MBU4367465.1 NUDIX domain-containing protein [Patescibacteria group bacterium]MBU4461785.1 NUDIX domain-containing protein [Patescibacteria group bacterium]MCG2700169.1 NUDIX domain-containing protein [Candidatus Parcubacteria bacterium]